MISTALARSNDSTGYSFSSNTPTTPTHTYSLYSTPPLSKLLSNCKHIAKYLTQTYFDNIYLDSYNVY